jgi:hypothetical protein
VVNRPQEMMYKLAQMLNYSNLRCEFDEFSEERRCHDLRLNVDVTRPPLWIATPLRLNVLRLGPHVPT